mmetsp:Transcript_135513/g.239600  ORF Transcript_135513/g.239600 Transcript_135513/m.239600 type:complete len:88 (+) Transcript_135513:313-576(+)
MTGVTRLAAPMVLASAPTLGVTFRTFGGRGREDEFRWLSGGRGLSWRRPLVAFCSSDFFLNMKGLQKKSLLWRHHQGFTLLDGYPWR